jgi:hypothetical protein
VSDMPKEDHRAQRPKRRGFTLSRRTTSSLAADSSSSHFDLAAEDPNWDAEWEGYAAGNEAQTQSGLGQLQAIMQLPTGQVELRGEFPQEVLDVLRDLLTVESELNAAQEASPRFDTEEQGVLPRLSFWFTAEGHHGAETDGAWRLEKDDADVVEFGQETSELFPALWKQLLIMSAELNPSVLHLCVPCLELNGYGLVIAGGPSAIRDQLIEELIRSGAAYLTADDLVLHQGTRTVFGSPSPRVATNALGMQQFEAASAGTQIVRQCAVGLILVLGEEEAEAASSLSDLELLSELEPVSKLAPLSMAQTTNELLSCRSLSESQQGPSNGIALEMTALLVAGSSCVTAPAPTTQDELDRLVQELQALLPPDRRRLAVLHRLNLEQDSIQPVAGKRVAGEMQPVSHMMRFDQDALLFAAESQRVEDSDSTSFVPRAEVLTPDQADQLIAQSERNAERNRPEAWPTPSAFGLTDCPSGKAAQALWQGLSLPETGQGVDMPSGVAVELLSRGLLEAPQATQDKVLHAHVLAQRHAHEVAGALISVLGVAAEVDVQPVVFGSLLQVWDGRLPEHFTDIGQLDLLIRNSELERLLARLGTQGFQSETRKLSKKAVDTDIEYNLRHPAIPEVVIALHATLAAGPFGLLVDPDEFHDRAVPVQVREHWVKGLHPEHRFVAACVAASASHTTESISESVSVGTDDDAPMQSVNKSGSAAPSIAQLREVVMIAPSSEELLMSAVECSSRLGAASKVFSAVRQADEVLPGLPVWLVQRARQDAGLPAEREMGLRSRLRSRKSDRSR